MPTSIYIYVSRNKYRLVTSYGTRIPSDKIIASRNPKEVNQNSRNTVAFFSQESVCKSAKNMCQLAVISRGKSSVMIVFFLSQMLEKRPLCLSYKQLRYFKPYFGGCALWVDSYCDKPTFHTKLQSDSNLLVGRHLNYLEVQTTPDFIIHQLYNVR